MRPWDYYFWIAELGDFPEKGMVLPMDWSTGKLPPDYSGKKTDFLHIGENKIKIVSSAESCMVSLAPES